jgi:hypothetical protein
MKFNILHYEESSPCEGAVRGEDVYRIQGCPFKTEEDYNDFAARVSKHGGSGKKWREQGFDHDVLGNGILVRKMPKVVWTIEIDTLDDLVAFAKKSGPFCISKDGELVFDSVAF